jgi:hypothetical protein
MKRSIITVVSVVAVMLLVAGVASADTIYNIEHSHSQGVGYANVSFNSGSSTVSAYLGRFVMQPITPSLPSIYPLYLYHSTNDWSFYSYCLEPTVSIGYGHGTTYPFTIGSLAGTDGIDAGDAALIKELFGRYSPLLKDNPTGPYTGGTFRTAAAALQLAIWKITLDRATETLGQWDFNSGLMRVASANVPLETDPDPDASAKADAVALLMLNSLTGTGPMASGLQGLASTTTQDVLIQMPEPATMAFLVLGGIATLLRRRRSSKK